MKTEDIKKMAQAWKQVQEASYGKKKTEASDTQMGTITVKTDAERKARAQAYRDKKAATNEAMDPVDHKELKGKHKDRKDKDINNDGKVDSTDKYLHNRRKTVSAAIKGKKKDQEVEVQTSEAKERKISPGMKALIDYGNKKAAATAKEVPASTDKVFAAIAAKRKQKMNKEEVEQVDEISKKTLGSYVKKASDDMANNAYALGARDPLKPKGSWNKAIKRGKGIAKATDKLTKEEAEQIDEISKEKAADYHAKSVQFQKDALRSNDPKKLKKIGNRLIGVAKANKIAGKVLGKESVEEAATHKPGVASPAGEGLSPSAKDQLAKKTPAPAAFDADLVNKKTFDAMRASAKKATMRTNDNPQGDKTPPKSK
jgi:hypothetical protein